MLRQVPVFALILTLLFQLQGCARTSGLPADLLLLGGALVDGSGAPPRRADVMSCPGAKRSTHSPRLENEARKSDRVEAPVPTACATRAGEELQASASSFPAATA